MYKENCYGFRLTCFLDWINSYHICDCGAVCDTGSFLHRGFFKLSFVEVCTMYLYFNQYFAFMCLLLLFCWCYLAILFMALQMSRSNLAILSFVFQSLASGFNYFIVNWRDFFMAWIWPDYRLVGRSKCHGDSHPTQFTLVLSCSCQLNYRHDLSRLSLAS